MKQWRVVAIVVSLIIVLLIANFSIQIKKRSRRNDKVDIPSKASVVDLTDLNGTAGLKFSETKLHFTINSWNLSIHLKGLQ
ncbi:hypothetical protein ACROYT_G000169 [Oculina patagonica]